jgi:hypothetical protein
MISRIQTRYVALVLFFVFCQVVGAMCALPDLSVAEETMVVVEESMACPMGGMNMCPPSLPSSPERQIKNSMIMDVDPAMIVFSHAAVLTVPMTKTLYSCWSSACSVVPISIGSSSVLRI